VAEPGDTRVLAIVDVEGCTLTAANVTFSVPVTAKTAGVAANYNIKGLEISSAKVLDSRRVKLATSKQSLRIPYTLVVKNIEDTTGNVIAEPGNTYTFIASDDCVTLEFTRITNNRDGTITIVWTGGSTLQVAPRVLGPWLNVPEAHSPQTLKPTARYQYFRLQR
jgi:hypothetical protein